MADIPYVPIIDNSTYANKKSSKERKELRLRDLGIESDSEGVLTISDPEAFISGLGLSDAYAERLMSEGIEFKDFDEFQKFIDTAVESGHTTKKQEFYDDIFSEESNLRSDAGIQKSSAGRSEESDKAADKAFNVKPKPAAPAPAPGQAQAARPTLDRPDNGTSAFARAAAQTMPDFVNRLNGNARWANQAKAQMMQEAKRRQQNEIAALKKSEKARKRAGEVDEILNAKNDQYRQLYANSSDDRSVEDWDAMSRDQKIKLIQNYNINRSLGAPAGEITGQKMNALESPRGSLEDIVYWDESKKVPVVPETPARNEAGGPQAEAPAPSLNEMRMDQMRDFARTPAFSPEVKTTATQGFDQISAPNGVPMTELETLNVSPMDDAAKQAALPQAFQNRGIREGEAPYDPARGLTNLQNPAPAPKQPGILNTSAPSIAQPDRGMSTMLPMDSVDLMNQVDAYEKANPPIPPSTAVTPVVSPESFDPQVRTPGSPDIDMEGIQSQVSADTRAELQNDRNIRDIVRRLPKPDGRIYDGKGGYSQPDPLLQNKPKSQPAAPAPKKEEGFLDKLKNFDLFDYVDDLQSQFNKPISPEELAKKRQAPPSMMNKFEPFRSKMLKKFDDKMGPIYDGDPTALNNLSKLVPDILDMDNYEQSPNVIRAKPTAPQAPAPQAPAPQAPAPAPTAKLPSADPFVQDEPATQSPSTKKPKKHGPRYIPRYGSQGFEGYIDNTDGRFIKHAGQGRKQMLDSLVRQDNEDAINRHKFENNNPFGSEFRPAAREYIGPVEKSPTPRTTAMMRNYDAMPKKQQLDVINSFRRHRGEDEIYNPFA